jgi:hypothetical protein
MTYAVEGIAWVQYNTVVLKHYAHKYGDTIYKLYDMHTNKFHLASYPVVKFTPISEIEGTLCTEWENNNNG